MNALRLPLTLCAALVVFAACGGSQPPIGVPGAMPQSNASDLPNADRYAVLFNFGTSSGSCVDGAYPTWGLVPVKGLLYGPTYEGGTNYGGTVFSISPAGAEHVVANFNLYDGAAGPSGLVAVNGHLYGARASGFQPYGTPFGGAIFSLHNDGKIRVLHTFGTGSDGSGPAAAPIAVGSKLYGTTYQGGAYGEGTVFAVDMETGRERILHNFTGQPDGSAPDADLVAVHGTLYGTTASGGANDLGSVFRIDRTSGTERTVYSFRPGRPFDGFEPEAGLIAINGSLYGTTLWGGTYGSGTIFSVKLDGSNESILHDFGAASDGKNPRADLIAVGGKLYGTTTNGGIYAGGSNSGGTLFSIPLAGGKEVVLHSFGNGTDGAAPAAPVVAVRHTLYGTTFTGGTNYSYCYSFYGSNGTVFKWKL